jgi:hypothetical protein
MTAKAGLKIPNLSDDNDGDDDDDDDDLQDTNFYAKIVNVKWDMLISEYDIGGSFRIF